MVKNMWYRDIADFEVKTWFKWDFQSGGHFEWKWNRKHEKDLKSIKMIKKVLNRQLIVFLADILLFEIYTILGKGFYRKPEVKSNKTGSY